MTSSTSHTNVLLLTQNIGSIECNTKELSSENKELTLAWTRSVASFLKREVKRGPIDVVVIHLQEIGGKKFNQAFNEYLRTVISQCYPDAAWCSGLLGPTKDDIITFTAMGSVLFLSQRMVDVASIWSFSKNHFVSISNWTDDESSEDYWRGAKFTNAGTSRKGYLLTTLCIGKSKPLNFVNLHLLHDGDNTVAASQLHPSEYVQKRAEALAEAVAKAPISSKQDPAFLFGDFNVRLDTHALKSMLEEKFQELIQLEKKKVSATDAVWEFLQNSQNWPTLKLLDKDAGYLQSTVRDKTGTLLEELPLEFGPTYLLEDDPSKIVNDSANKEIDKSTTFHDNDAALTACYKRHSRFPAWCDRVWFNEAGKSWLHEQESVAYWTATLHPMDHLSVYVRFAIQ